MVLLSESGALSELSFLLLFCSFLAFADVGFRDGYVVGTQASTFSLLAKLRVQDWGGGETILV